jgi:hypothetical protein
MKPDLKAIMSKSSAPMASDAMHEEPDGDEDAAEPTEDGKESDDPMVQAAGLVREAITAGDDEALADALKSFSSLHSSAPSMAHKPKLVGT